MEGRSPLLLVQIGLTGTAKILNMRFSLFGRKPKAPLTIEHALASKRPDLDVAEWLQLRGWGDAPMPPEVNAAHFTDYFLSSVHMGGALSLIDEGSYLDEIVSALNTVGLSEFGTEFDAIRNLPPENRPSRADALDEQVMSEAKRIEQTNHNFIHRNLDIFKGVD